jgi:very-short-patch-repair endonuclease
MNIWEEKNSIELEKNSSNYKELGRGDTTNETKLDSTNGRCNDTGKIWKRKCPTCNNDIKYNRRCNYLKADRNKCRCKKCYTKDTNRGRFPTECARRNMSAAHKGKKHTESTLQKMRGNNNGMYGVYRCGEQNPFYGKKHTEETRKKMRLAMCKKIVQKNKETGQIANVNPNETKYFTKLDREMEWNGIFYGKSSEQHLLDIGYFVDYYEPTLNIVVEYDELRHYRCGKLRSRDVERMNNIKTALGCRFLRYNEKTGLLTEY